MGFDSILLLLAGMKAIFLLFVAGILLKLYSAKTADGCFFFFFLKRRRRKKRNLW